MQAILLYSNITKTVENPRVCISHFFGPGDTLSLQTNPGFSTVVADISQQVGTIFMSSERILAKFASDSACLLQDSNADFPWTLIF